MRTRRFVLRFFALALSAATAVHAEPARIRVGALKGPSGIALIRLFETPPTLPDGSLVEAVAVPNVEAMTAKIVAGECDFAVLPINVAAKLAGSGIPVRLAAVIGDGMVAFLAQGSAISSFAELKGREVYVAGQGATPDYLFRRLLKEANLDPERDVRLNYSLPYPEMAAALASGRIGFAVLPEPFATAAISANAAISAPLDLGALWTKATGQASYPMTALVVNTRLATERPEIVRAVLAAAKGSIEAVKADPDTAARLVEKHDLGLKAAIAAKAIPRSAYVYTPAYAARSAVEALLKVFLELAPASVGGKLPDAAFYAAF